MRTVNHIGGLFLLFVVISLQACKEEALPDFNGTLNVVLPENVQDSVYPGDIVSFDVVIRAAAGLHHIEVKQAAHPFEPISEMEMDSFGNGTDFIYPFQYNAKDRQPGEVMNWVIVAFDNNGITKTVPYRLRVVQRPTRTAIALPSELPTAVAAGEEIQLTVLVDAPDSLKQIVSKKNGTVLEDLTKTSFENPVADSYVFSYTTTADDGGDNTFTIEVVDRYDNKQSVSFTVEVTGAARLVNIFTDIQLGGQLNTSFGQFLDLETGTVYPIADAKQNSALVDLVSFHSGNTGVALAAPNNGNAAQFVYNPANFPNDYLAGWTVRNATQFRKVPVDSPVTTDNFDEIQADELVVAAFEAGGTSVSTLSPLQVGDVIAFRTAGGKTGVLIVRTRTQNNADHWTIDVKVQR